MAHLIFELTWDPAIPAQLRVLRDNAVELLSHKIKSNMGRITLQWEASDLIAHFIDWELWAPGEKLEDLKAIAAWEDQDPTTLAEDDDAQNVWRKGGSV